MSGLLTERNDNTLPMLLVLFPLAVICAPSLWVLAMLTGGCLLLAYHCRCLPTYLVILLGAFAINACVVSSFALFCDADYVHLPAIRLYASALPLEPDGAIHWEHLQRGYPLGFVRWGAMLYRLTGWVDMGAALPLILLPAAWLTLRQHLTRLQTAILCFAPLFFLGVFNPMPDASVYLLLLAAVIALRDKRAYGFPLLAVVLASSLKITAWVPTFFILLVLLRDHPRHCLKIIGAGLAIGVMAMPFVLRSFGSTNIDQGVTGDFYDVNAKAQAMGFWARQAYAYLGHFFISGEPPVINVPSGGADGGGIDGLGPFFRVAVWCSLGVVLLLRKRLSGWWTTLLICWGAALVVPTVYIGYARYVPLIYVAVMLPLVVAMPRLTAPLALAVCAMPMAWVGWRVMRSSENLYALSPHTTAVHSNHYNVRCELREKLSAQPQPSVAGSLMYSYTADGSFPVMPRETENQRLTPALTKAKGLAHYAVATWLPWAILHLPEMAWMTAVYRWERLVSPRGENDGPQTP